MHCLTSAHGLRVWNVFLKNRATWMNGLSGKIVFEIISHTSTLFDNKCWLNKLEPRPCQGLTEWTCSSCNGSHLCVTFYDVSGNTPSWVGNWPRTNPAGTRRYVCLKIWWTTIRRWVRPRLWPSYHRQLWGCLVVRACIRESKKRKVLMCLDVPYYYCTSRGAVLFANFAILKCSVQRNMAQATILRPTKKMFSLK